MLNRVLLLFIFLSFLSCDELSKTEKAIEQIPVNLEIIRFDQRFASATPGELSDLKAEFPFLFPENVPDSVWVYKMNDSIQQELDIEVARAFSEFSTEEDKLHELFQHVKYYFPSFQIPKVITLTSEVDYRNKVLLTPEYLFISLDTYLGKDHKFYIGIQEFLKKNFEKNQILPDVAAEIGEKYVPQPEDKTFLAHMVYYGKMMYLKEALLPETPDNEKIGYNPEEWEWAKTNEEQIWRYFVEREILFDSDTQLYSRFLYPAPFSKFYLQLDNEAPAMLGQYIGWQIVREYMEKNDASLQEMLDTNAETIFNSAKYKPSK